ncbi:MAG TPA: glycosyltransferase family 9 protein [Flavobacteriaceae bacterium]
MIPIKPIKHILVIRLSAMGDVAMTVPVLRALTQQHPDIKITVLTRAFFYPFFKNIPNVTVYAAEVNKKHKGLFGLFRLSNELKTLQIDAIADLHQVLRSRFLKLFLLGKKAVQIDKGRAEKKALVSGQLFRQLKTTHQRYADVFAQLGFPVDLSNPTFPKKESLSQNVSKIAGNKTKKWIGVAPFAAHESKMYPLDLLGQVIEALSKTHKVVLFGGGTNEIEILNALENKFQNTINVAGKLTLEEELNLISNLNAMLSMDSGNAHIAAMLGVKVVTIWGVTHPYAGFAPFNQPEDYMLLSDRKQFPRIPTSVYGNKYPENYREASRSIAPETIIKKIESII